MRGVATSSASSKTWRAVRKIPLLEMNVAVAGFASVTTPSPVGPTRVWDTREGGPTVSMPQNGTRVSRFGDQPRPECTSARAGRLSSTRWSETRYASNVSNVAFDVPEETLLALKLDERSASAELRLVAAVKLFELGRLSSGAAATLRVPRVVFLAKLGELGASPAADRSGAG